jgi:hypothetical protein
MYDWCESVGLISPTYQVFDGTDALLKCTELNHIQWYATLPGEDEAFLMTNVPSQVIQHRHLPPRRSSDVEPGDIPNASG